MPRHIRFFISSPGDVPDERAIAHRVIEDLQYDPDLRDQISVEIVAWDKPGAPPMEANIPPQEAINRGLMLPAECDVVIILFWTRMGTPCVLNGRQYQSGTEFEYRNAMAHAETHGTPRILVYRRIELSPIYLGDPQAMEKHNQFQRVKDFFNKEFQDNSGAIRGGYNPYQTPDDFRVMLEDHLRHIAKQMLVEHRQDTALPEPQPLPLWEGSPFPGLRAFQPQDAPIFFGRSLETDKLTERVRSNQFVAVVGASGSGKSSLIGAGLIPRLRDTSGENSWIPIPFTPDNLGEGNPFASLATTLLRNSDAQEEQLAKRLHDTPGLLAHFCNHVLSRQPENTRLLLFIDQFEELFTTVDPQFRLPFIRAIIQTLKNDRVHIVITVRGDFYGNCVEVPELAGLLETSTFPLSVPQIGALAEMIRRPAARAGLSFEEGLAERILNDTGDNPGALALMAYALDELYRRRTAEGTLTFADYEDLGGVQGAIGRRSEETFRAMTEEQKAALPYVFRELVSVKDDGTVTRKRALIAHVVQDEHSQAFIAELTKARLLVVNRGRHNQPYVEIAHEALLNSWTRLANWITETQDELRLLRQVRQAAEEWEAAGYPDYYLWQHERLQPVYEMQQHLNLEFDDIVAAFIKPEADRLLEEFEDLLGVSPREALYRQMNIVDRLTNIGEPAVRSLLVARRYSAGPGVSNAIEKLIDSFDTHIVMKHLRQMLDSGNGWLIWQARRFITDRGWLKRFPEEAERMKREDLERELIGLLKREETPRAGESPERLKRRRQLLEQELAQLRARERERDQVAQHQADLRQRRQTIEIEQLINAAETDLPHEAPVIDEPPVDELSTKEATPVIEEPPADETSTKEAPALLLEQENDKRAEVKKAHTDRLRRTQELAQKQLEAAQERERQRLAAIDHQKREHAQRRLLSNDLDWAEIEEQTQRWIEVEVRHGSLDKAERLSTLKRQAQSETLDPALQQAVRTLLHAADYRERYFAAQKLTGRRQASVILCLLQAAQDDNEWVRQATVNALSASDDTRVLPFIQAMTEDDHGDVSAAARAALANLIEQPSSKKLT